MAELQPMTPPPQTQNKFYKTSANGVDSYQVIPDTGNIPHGYQSVSYDDYVKGQNAELARLSSLNPNYQKQYGMSLGGAALSDINNSISRINADLAKYKQAGIDPNASAFGQSGYTMAGADGKTPMTLQSFQNSQDPSFLTPDQFKAQNQSMAGMSQQQIYDQSAQKFPDLAKVNPFQNPEQLQQGVNYGSALSPVYAAAPGTGVQTPPSTPGSNFGPSQAGQANLAATQALFGQTPTAPYTPPNQDSGMARNLKAEQDFVKNWGGKEGRLPTANEINKAVYGTENPSFNTVQGIKPPATTVNPTPGAAAPSPNPTAGETTRDLAKEQAFVQAWQGKEGRLPTSSEINQGVYGTPNPQFSTPQGIRPPEPITQNNQATPNPTAVSSTPQNDYLSVLEKSLTESNTPTTQEQTLQQQEDALLAQMRQLNASKAAGLVDISGQPVPMAFIVGQSKNLEDRANAQNIGTQAQIDTLERQLSRLQADRAARRQSALDISGVAAKRDEIARDEAKTKVNEAKAATEAARIQAEKNQDQELNLIKDDFLPVPIGQVPALQKEGYDIIEFDGKVYAKAPPEQKLTHTTYKGVTTFYDEQGNKVTPGAATKSSSVTVAPSAKPATPNSSQKPVQNTTTGKTLDQLLTNYPAAFKAHVKSIAPTVQFKLDAGTIGSMYQQFQASEATKKEESSAVKEMKQAITAAGGLKVSNYDTLKAQWVAAGFSASSFDKNFNH